MADARGIAAIAVRCGGQTGTNFGRVRAEVANGKADERGKREGLLLLAAKHVGISAATRPSSAAAASTRWNALFKVFISKERGGLE